MVVRIDRTEESRMSLKGVIWFCIACLIGGACTSSPSPSRAGGSPSIRPAASSLTATGRPAVDPADFVSTIDNPYFSLIPGTTFVYEGIKDGERQRDEVKVSSKTKVILGVTCVVVNDVASHDGTPLEVTEDWYAQDKDGNVWYFGEDTKELDENGKVVSTEGSWQAGVDGAQPGIFMPANPQVTDSFRQEFYEGHAEDMFWIISLSQKVEVPYGSFDAALTTLEWTPLDPKIIDRKYYVSGVGLVLEASATGPNERFQLVGVTMP
jgi:hypothetical protein